MLSWLLLSTGLRAPANVVAKVETCDTVTLQWTQSSKPNDITTSVSCTPPSPGCAECTTSPCNITGLNPSNEYVFTVTLNSGKCGTSMKTTGIGTRGEIKSVKKKNMAAAKYFEQNDMSIIKARIIFIGKAFLIRIGKVPFFANVLEGLFGENHSSSVALDNVLSCQSLLSRVLAGILAFRVFVSRVQCSMSCGIFSAFNTLTPYVKVTAWP